MSTFEFPPELELEILQIAANDSRRTALALVRVCRRVQIWIDPILYATIVLNENNSRCVLRAMEAKGDAFIGKHVKNVWIPAQTIDHVAVLFPSLASDAAVGIENRRCMRRALSKCKAVENVMVRRRDIDGPDIWESGLLRSGGHPTHLSTYSNIFLELKKLMDSPDNDLDAKSVVSLFANVTHLETKTTPSSWATFFPGLSVTVPSLTHLAMCWSAKSWKSETDSLAMAAFVAQHPAVEVILLLTRNAHADLDVLQFDASDLGSLRVVIEYDYSHQEGMCKYSPASNKWSVIRTLGCDGDDSVSQGSMWYDRAMEDMDTQLARWKWAEGKVRQQLQMGKHDFSDVIKRFEEDLYDEWEYELRSGDFEGIWDSGLMTSL